MRWQFRFAKDAIFGILPFSQQLRRLKRMVVPYNIEIDVVTLEQGIRQAQMIEESGLTVLDRNLIEIGTGWKPLIPLVMYLKGCREILMVDSQRLLDKNIVLGVVRSLLPHKVMLARACGTDEAAIVEKLTIDESLTLDEIFRKFHMTYLAPVDFTRMDLADGSTDVIITRAVLEHVPPEVIRGIFRRSHSLLSRNGRMCHIIDNSDHWEHRDKRLSRLNYLKFSDGFFKWLNRFNPLDYQNRLRHFEYIDMLNDSAFEIIYEEKTLDRKALEDLNSIRICKRYRNVSHEELAIVTSYIVAGKKQTNERCE